MKFNEIAKTALSRQDIDIVVDQKSGQLWLVHAVPFMQQDKQKHAEYDTNKKRIDIIFKDGSRQHLGVKVQKPLHPHIKKATQITTILAIDEEIQELHEIPIYIKE